jgi:hypothetical protein
VVAEEFRGRPEQLPGLKLDEDEKDARPVVEQMGIDYR